MPKIIKRLNEQGIAKTRDMIMAEVGQGIAGRPHIASALIKMGVVKNIDEAFDLFLSKGRSGYVEKLRLDIRRTLELIHQAGGLPVLAHPLLVDFKHTENIEALIKSLCDMGLMGVEAYYSQHPPEAVARFLEIAKRLDLLVTGGSDYHGTLLPDIQMGSGTGDLFVPFTVYESIIERKRKTANK